MKKALCFFFIISVFITYSCNQNNYVVIDGEKIIVEVAEDKNDKEHGLMFRDALCEECGMIFVYDKESIYTFWMKNTFIPLDIIFISSDMTVVDVLHAEPCADEPCKLYVPKEKACYVLETNANKFDNETIGKKVKILI